MEIIIENDLCNEQEQSQFYYEFNDITYEVTSADKSKRKILNGVSGRFSSNKFTVILGPSGAGKTSLLNILAAQRKSGVTGERRIINKLSTNYVGISYITQQFSLLSKLTVRETLEYAADFKLPGNTSAKVKKKIVSNIMNVLKLNKCSSTLVENISGGESKRLSIGIELVSNPSIMLIDEPTSGLDIISSLQIIEHLKKLSTDNRLIVCVLHQPSSQLMEFFDDVYVLSAGNCIYNGHLNQLIPTMECVGYECPQYCNRADFALEIASHDPSELQVLIEGNKVKKIVDAQEPSNLIKNYDVDHCKEESIKLMKINEKSVDLNDKDFPISQWKQFFILVKRSLLCTRRDFLFAQLRVICHILVGLLLGIVFYDIGNESSKILTNASCIFFFILFIYFANAMPTVLSVPLETSVFIREHSNRWYSLPAYFMSKLVADIPLQFICPTLFLIVAYMLTSQPMEIERFIMTWAMMLLITMVAQLNGLVAGAATNMQMGVFIVPVISIPMLIFSGFFARTTDVFPWLHPIFDVSYFRHSFQGTLKVIYGYGRENLTCSEMYCHYKQPAKFLKYMNISVGDLHVEIIGLIAWILILQIMFYIILRIKLRNYNK